MGNLINDTTKSAKQQAKQIAKTIAREPLEIGRVAKDTLIGSEKPVSQVIQPSQDTLEKPISDQEKALIESKRKRMMQALETQLADIRKQKKIEAEEEEKEAENLKLQNQEEIKRSQTGAIEVSSKPGRKFVAGMKSHLQRLKKSTETRMQPSG